METSSTTEYVKKNATIEKVVIVIQRDRERERIDDLCTGKKRIEKLRKL